jgi:hypothetical protein
MDLMRQGYGRGDGQANEARGGRDVRSLGFARDDKAVAAARS